MKIIDDITDFIFLEDRPEPADIIFIPGGSYAEIAERAAELWSEGYSRVILPSVRYSVKRGYFPGPSSKTDENAIYSKRLLMNIISVSGRQSSAAKPYMQDGA